MPVIAVMVAAVADAAGECRRPADVDAGDGGNDPGVADAAEKLRRGHPHPALDALLNWLASSIRMPWLVASRLPLTTMAPMMVLSIKAMPVFAVIVPLLTMSPVNDDTAYCCGLVAEPSLMPTAPGGERAVVGDAASEGRDRNCGNAGRNRSDCPSVDDAAGDNGVVIESNSGFAGREDRAAVDDAAGKIRDELYKNAAMSRYSAAIGYSVGDLGNVVD